MNETSVPIEPEAESVAVGKPPEVPNPFTLPESSKRVDEES